MSFADLPGITLHMRQEGSDGPYVVLLHELGGSLDSFDAVAARLASQFHVLRYDQRGAGSSEKPRQAFGIQDHVADLAALLDAIDFGRPVLLVGVAAGAAVAVATALAWPGLVAGLVLCSPALSVAADRRSYLADRSSVAAKDGMRAIADATLDRSWPLRMREADGAFAAYRARFLGNDPLCYGYANMALVNTDVHARLGGLTIPCRILAGRHDLLRPPTSVGAVAGLIAGADFTIVEESGHLMNVQAPGAIVSAIAALQRDIETGGRFLNSSERNRPPD